MSIIEQSPTQDKSWASNWHDGFGYIFWGLILVFISISINGFDLLPDGLGYILIALGTVRFSNLSPHFTTASALSWVLLLIWCGSFFAAGAIAWDYVTTCFRLAMYWFLLGGIMDAAIARQRPDLAHRASNYRVIYAAVTVVGMLVFFAGPLVPVLVVIAAIAGLAVGVFILQLIYHVRHQLA